MTVYALEGDARKGPGKPWLPAEAPQLSSPVGDFGFVVRADGIKQWTYKGRGLYTYALDLAPGDANGIGADKNLDVAAVARYFLPPNVTVQTTLARGKVLATGLGQTLYRREAHIDQTGSGHNLRRGQPIRPAVGREIGIANVRCDATCRKQWHPYAAPAGAVTQGQWSVITHPDGFRQWVYQGYPLWTFDGDTKPGDMTGNDDSLYAFSGMAHAPSGVTPETLVDIGTPQDGGIGLYWLIASP
jgi:predicted lipoprotein with Yx(FWY)xxD motif